MKFKASLLIGVLAISLVLFQHCKPENQLPCCNQNDPDSLYASPSYTLLKPFRFPTIIHTYKDSLSVAGIELGRRLFYDAKISGTGSISCASCHHQKYAFADSSVVFHSPVMGANSRNTPTIQNLLWSNRLFWNGRAVSVKEAVTLSLQYHLSWNVASTILYLQADSVYTGLFKKAFGRPGNVTEQKVVLALQQFLLTLISADSHFDRVQRLEETFTSAEADGFQIFLTEAADCYHCHSDGVTLIMTDNLFRNIGLDSVADLNEFIDKGRGEVTGNTTDNGKFKTASLRNVALTPPYMHDGRFGSLEGVVEFYSTGMKSSPNLDMIMQKVNHANGGLQLTVQQKSNLVQFLKSLTDTAFINNPNLADPF